MSDDISKILKDSGSLKSQLDSLGKTSLKSELDAVSNSSLKDQFDSLSNTSLKNAMDAIDFKNPLDGLSMEVLTNLSYPHMDNLRMPALPKIPSMWEVQAELFMEGLKDQARSLEKSLKQDEELIMTCWHGSEKLQVRSVSMPSENVVALHCVDADGNQIQVTGHMSAITFSFMVYKVQPPAKPSKIGFSMPSQP